MNDINAMNNISDMNTVLSSFSAEDARQIALWVQTPAASRNTVDISVALHSLRLMQTSIGDACVRSSHQPLRSELRVLHDAIQSMRQVLSSEFDPHGLSF